jgi:GTP-binding protein
MPRPTPRPQGDAGSSRLPAVVLTGRPNVGKSTLFNRIVGEARAVVEATPGVTRDRLYAAAEWAGRRFALTDTGGLGGGDGDPFAAQAEAALADADVVVLVVDARAGLVPGDHEIAARVRRLGKPVVVVANKADRPGADDPYEFYLLGLGEPFPVSAARGEGLGDALDRVVALLGDAPPQALEEDAKDPEDPKDPEIPVAFVGRPNVGKSSLVNRLLGQDRLIVSEIAGTTRDAVDIPWTRGGRRFVLVDTPGLRRPSRIDPASLERWVAQRSAGAIRRAQVAVLVLDCTEPFTEQDKRIAGLIKDRRRAAVIALNKADALSGTALAELSARVRSELPFLDYAPSVACSARTGHGVEEVASAAAAAADSHRRRVATAALNQCVRAAVAMHPPAAHEGKPVRIYFAAQIGVCPPTIALVTSRRGAVADAYARYLENRIRERFALTGSPVRWVFRERAGRRLRLAARTQDSSRDTPLHPPTTRT